MKAPSRRSVWLCLVLVVLAVASGCTAKKPQASTSAGDEKVRLGYSDWPGWYPWDVASKQGLFEDAGLDVELTFFDNYTDSLNALNAGRLDANSQTLNDTLLSVASGAQQVIVLVNDNSTGNDQIIVKPGINSVADLRGRKVAAEEATVDHYLLLLGLDRAGLSAKDIEFLPLPTKDAANALVNGQVDAAGVFAPFTSEALKLPGSKALFSSADFPGAIPDHLVFTRAFVDEHPGTVQKLVDVWFKTQDFIAGNHDEAVKILAARADVTPEEYGSYDAGTRIFTIQENLEAFTPGTTDANLDFQAKKIATFQKDVGISDKDPDLTGLFDDRFVKAAGAP